MELNVHYLPLLLVLPLLSTALSSSTEGTPSPNPNISINGSVLTVTCGGNVTLPQAQPLSSKSWTILLELEPEIVGNVTNCGMVIPAPSDPAGVIVFQFRFVHQLERKRQCWNRFGSNNVTESVEMRLDNGVQLADSCMVSSDWKIPGYKGLPVVIEFYSRNVTETRLVLGNYSYISVQDPACGNDTTSRRLVAGNTPHTVEFPGQDGVQLLIPRNTQCQWRFVPDQPTGSVSITIHRLLNATPPICSVFGDLQIIDGGFNRFFFSNCSHPVSTFRYTSMGVLTVSLRTTIENTPGFVITYRATPAKDLCPAVPMQLESPLYGAGFLKGVNMEGAETCFWNVTAPEAGFVIEFDRMYSTDYVHDYCQSFNDSLVFDAGAVHVSMCDNSRFPIWGRERSSLVTFHAHSGGRGNTFVLSYVTVLKKDCQGYPVDLEVTNETRKFPLKSLNLTQRYQSYDCRWLLQTKLSGFVVRVTARLQYKNYGCTNTLFFAYDSDRVDSGLQIPPTCPDTYTQVFTSRPGRPMLFIIDTNHSPLNLDVSYQAVRPPPPPSNGCGGCYGDPLVKACWVFIMMMMCIM